MRILSIDVGIKNLSYVLIEINSIRPILDWKIIEWNNVNINHSFNNLNYVFLEHKKWTKTTLIECTQAFNIDIPSKVTKDELCILIGSYLRDKGVKKSNATIELQTVVENVANHFNSVFRPLKCDAVIIENQPCMKNPQMKSMQMIVFTYFCLLKGEYVVKCVSASSKMRFCKSIGWIEQVPKGYAHTKACSIEVVTKLLGDSPPDLWNKSNKKDDLSDVIIQAFAYCDKLV